MKAEDEVRALREAVESVLDEAPHVNCPDTCTCWQRRVRAALASASGPTEPTGVTEP